MEQNTLSSYLSEEQKQIFAKIFAVIDKRPIKQNEDFVSFNGKIEPTKSFFQKSAYLAGISFSANQPQIVETTSDTIVTVNVTARVGSREVSVSGASSIQEVGRKNPRAIHDAVARAQTRAFKIAVENLLGYAFINQIILSVFGGYEDVTNNVTAMKQISNADETLHVTQNDDELTMMKRKLWDKLKTMNQNKALSDEKMRNIIEYVKQRNDIEAIKNILNRLEKEEGNVSH